MTQLLFTRFTSSEPLAKVFSKDGHGSVVKKTSAQMYRGHFDTLAVDVEQPGAAQRLAATLSTFGHNQALSASLGLSAESGVVVTKMALPANPGAVARDAKHFGYRPGVAGLLVGDMDPPKGRAPLTPTELWNALLSLWPEVERGLVVHMHSASSLIFDGDHAVIGIGGQRIYAGIESQADLPRALVVLNKRAWLRGIGGHIHVAANGSMRVRSLFDSAFGDAGGRLDFAPAGAVTLDGLDQRRGDPTVYADGGLTDTKSTLPDLSPAEEAEYVALVAAARVKAEPEASAQRESWLLERQQAAMIAAFSKGDDPDAARERVRRELDALLGGVLVGGAALIHVTDEGNEVIVTVDELLADPKCWHGKAFLSPSDPDHRDRSPDAIAYLMQAQPVIFDLNDSGVVYRLQRQPLRLQMTQGNKAQLAEQIATELAAYPDLMSCAGLLARVVSGAFVAVPRPMLLFIIGTRIALYRQNKEQKQTLVDCDQATADMVHALLTERARAVSGRSSIALIDPTGRVIDRQGLDTPTGFYLELADGEGDNVPLAPTRSETVSALRRLWHPWSKYQWVSPHDLAAMVATVLTVPMRPTIDAAPGLFVDAAGQGAGKSSAIGAILALVQGHRGNMKSWTGDSEVELEKYLLSLARSGAAAVAWDNVLNVFDSSTIATAVVEGRVSARQLGHTQALSPTFRAMWLASGNNASLGRDCGSRFAQARIACPGGQPHKQPFPFEPSEAALFDRHGIIRAIITVHRAWHSAGSPRADKINTRFPTWGRTIRAMVQWLQESGIADEAGIGPLGDPAHSILERVAQSDPDNDASIALLSALHEKYASEAFGAREVANAVRDGREAFNRDRHGIWDAITGLMPRAAHGVSAQSVSAIFKNRRDRDYAGLMLVAVHQTGREAARQGQLFRVVEV